MTHSLVLMCPTPVVLNPLKRAEVLIQTGVEVLVAVAAVAVVAAGGSGIGFEIVFVGEGGQQGGFSLKVSYLEFWDLVWVQVLDLCQDRSLVGPGCPAQVGVQVVAQAGFEEPVWTVTLLEILVQQTWLVGQFGIQIHW